VVNPNAQGVLLSAGETAVVTMKFADLRAAFEFVMRSSRTSRARITIGYDGRELILLRARSSARVPAAGHWPGVATIYGRGVIEKLALLTPDGDEVTLRVIGPRLSFGDFVVDCSWERQSGR
jgi:hypothetical protein